MSWISLLILIKISVTALLVALPFLLFPKDKLENSTGITTPTPLLFRLYGVAILALLVGYSFGIPAAENGTFPWEVVFMGLVSNGGATVFLMVHSRKNRATIIITSFFAVITLGLIVTAFAPDSALQKIW